MFGVILTPDSPGYVSYAHQILAGPLPSHGALLREAPAPVTLFRMGGYPALLALLMRAAPAHWALLAVMLQIAAMAVLASLAFHTGRRLGLDRCRSALAALLPAIGFGVVVQICILTDAIYTVLMAAAALMLLPRATPRRAVAAGALLGMATSFREATPYLALFYLPLAFGGTGRTRRLLCAALVVLPSWGAVSAQKLWNVQRGAGPVVTASRMTVMVQAVLPLLKHGLPVYDGDDAFDRAARATVGAGAYGRIDALHTRLFQEGWTAPRMAAAASARYGRAWRRFPIAMLRATVSNFRYEFLAMPFQPLETVDALLVYRHDGDTGWRQPEFVRLDRLWRRLRGGDPVAALWLLLGTTTRLLGTAIALAAIMLPWTRRGDPVLRALCCAASGFAILYMPVHLEPRYLLPAVPLLCLIAMAASRPRGLRP